MFGSVGPSSIGGASARSGIEDRYDRAKAFIAGQPGPAAGGGTVGVLRRLCGAAVQTMAASGAGVTLMTGDGVRVATCWDLVAVHRLIFGGWSSDPEVIWAALPLTPGAV